MRSTYMYLRWERAEGSSIWMTKIGMLETESLNTNTNTFRSRGTAGDLRLLAINKEERTASYQTVRIRN